MEEYKIDIGFKPIIWPEDKLPPEADDYQNCEVCTHKSRVIWGEGNPDASVIIILDNPGAREDKEGNEYACGTRETLQLALYKTDLHLDDIYLTYLLKCRPLRKYDKDRARAFSKPFLEQQIKNSNADYLVCLGDVVAQSLFKNDDAHVKDLRGNWHQLLERPTIVTYHPLAVRRRPNLLNNFLSDWEMLKCQSVSEQNNKFN